MNSILSRIEDLKTSSGADTVAIIKKDGQEMRVRLSKNDHHVEMLYHPGQVDFDEHLAENFKGYLSQVGNR